jgi:hypothetical protein
MPNPYQDLYADRFGDPLVGDLVSAAGLTIWAVTMLVMFLRWRRRDADDSGGYDL